MKINWGITVITSTLINSQSEGEFPVLELGFGTAPAAGFGMGIDRAANRDLSLGNICVNLGTSVASFYTTKYLLKGALLNVEASWIPACIAPAAPYLIPILTVGGLIYIGGKFLPLTTTPVVEGVSRVSSFISNGANRLLTSCRNCIFSRAPQAQAAAVNADAYAALEDNVVVIHMNGQR